MRQRTELVSGHILAITLLILVLFSSCVPEVVKYNAEGNTQFEQGAYPEALDAYRLAQVSEPDQPEPYYNAANTYNRQGDVAGTALQTEQALKSVETDLKSNAWYNLGNAHFDAQQWQEAVDAYKQALRLNPEDDDAKHNLELAMQAVQDEQSQEDENQQEQEQQQESQGQGEQDSSDQESSSEEGTEEQPPQASESQQTEELQQTEQTQEMTQEQARQLLQALLGDSETLQEHMQQYFVAPGAAPEEDW